MMLGLALVVVTRGFLDALGAAVLVAVVVVVVAEGSAASSSRLRLPVVVVFVSMVVSGLAEDSPG